MDIVILERKKYKEFLKFNLSIVQMINKKIKLMLIIDVKNFPRSKIENRKTLLFSQNPFFCLKQKCSSLISPDRNIFLILTKVCRKNFSALSILRLNDKVLQRYVP